MEKLKQLHDEIKEHPYRVLNEEKHLAEYKNLLYKLSDAFYFAVIETKYKVAKNLVHDFNGAITNLGRDKYRYAAINDFHIEYCIGVVHKFIDTGTIDEFQTYYPDPHFLIFLGPYRKYKWNEELNGYYLVVPKEQMNNLENELSAGERSEYWIKILEDARRYNV